MDTIGSARFDDGRCGRVRPYGGLLGFGGDDVSTYDWTCKHPFHLLSDCDIGDAQISLFLNNVVAVRRSRLRNPSCELDQVLPGFTNTHRSILGEHGGSVSRRCRGGFDPREYHYPFCYRLS